VIVRRRFSDVIRRQLDLFERDHADLLQRCADARDAHRVASRDDAEERYGDYQDLVDETLDRLFAQSDAYAATLAGSTAEVYATAFERAARQRLRSPLGRSWSRP
jgi:hypothetical protein